MNDEKDENKRIVFDKVSVLGRQPYVAEDVRERHQEIYEKKE